MRALAILLLLSGAVAAEPGQDLGGSESTAAERRAAAIEVARLPDRDRRVLLARAYAITDDAAIRDALVGALLADGELTEAQARRVPSARTLRRELKRLVRRPALPLDVRDCGLAAGTGSDLVITCHAGECQGACQHHTLDVTVAVGRAWRLMSVRDRTTDDGVCGCCMF